MRNLHQSTAETILVFLNGSTDHVTGATGLTLTITASKAAAAFASITPTVTERGNGWYAIALTTSHTDTLGDLALHITGTGADPADVLMRVGPAPADVIQWNGSTVATPTVAGVPEVDLTHVNGVAASGAAAVDANVIEIDGSSVAADRLSAQMLAFVTGSVNDASATTTSFIGDSGLSATDDIYNSLLIVPSSGTLAGIPRTVTNYVGSSKTFTVDVAWPSAPANATTFILIGKGGSPA